MRIVYIDIDSLRPDHLGCYGYHRDTSPMIDAVAKDGVVFNNAYTPDAPCLPSRTALYSGRFGIQTGVVGHGATAAEPKVQGYTRGFRDLFNDQGLAYQLQKRGYHTTMISPFAQRHAAWHVYAGFKEIQNTGMHGMESAEDVQPTVLDWLSRHEQEDNWYLHINYWDAHTPYRLPSGFKDRFKDEPIPKWLDDEELIARHGKLAGPHSAKDIGMYGSKVNPSYPGQVGSVTSRGEMRRLIDGYDESIYHVDQSIGEVVQRLKEANLYEDTAIIISSDHGENFGELGVYAEHATADRATCRIPLIIKWPGGACDEFVGGFAYNVDLVPTIAELLELEKQEVWDGISFSPSIKNGEKTSRNEVIVSQCAHVCQRSVLWDDWLYIRTYHDGFHDFPQEMLFDLSSDPHEQNDLAVVNPAVCFEGQWRLSRWHDKQMKKMADHSSDVIDPLWTVMREGGPFHARLTDGTVPGAPNGGVNGFLEYLTRLENTGRGEAAERLRSRYRKQLSKLGSN